MIDAKENLVGEVSVGTIKVNVEGFGEDVSKYISNELTTTMKTDFDSMTTKFCTHRGVADLVKEIPSFKIVPDPNSIDSIEEGFSPSYLFTYLMNVEKINKFTMYDGFDMKGDASYMFDNCICLKEVDLSGFDTSKITKMYGMFNQCSSLTKLDLSNFDTSNVTYMSNMFRDCSSLTELDLSNFNTSNVTNMYLMFYGCSSLTNLNLSNFDFSKVTNYDGMFYNVPTNCYILVKDATAKEWITSKFADLTNVHYVGE